MKDHDIKQGNITIRVATHEDQDPDLSYLGDYTNVPVFPYWDRHHKVIVHNAEEVRETVSTSGQFIGGFQCPESDEAMIADAARLEAYRRCEWHCVGITATAYIGGKDFGHAALWGIESDSDEAYFKEVCDELVSEASTQAKEELAKFCKEHCPA